MSIEKKKETFYVSPGDSLRTLLNGFKNLKVSHFPVVQSGKMMAVVSKTDVIDYLVETLGRQEDRGLEELSEDTRVSSLMVQPLVQAKMESSTQEICRLISEKGVGSVMIVDNEKLMGIVTSVDICRYLAESKEEESPFTNQLMADLVSWLDKKGVLQVSRMLSDIGI